MTAYSAARGRLTGRRRRSNKERFLDKIQRQENGCWFWLGWRDRDGYGMFNFRFPDDQLKDIRASHAALNIFCNVPLPIDEQACHHCDNSACVNPEHIFQGSQLANMHDMIEKDRGMYGERNWNAVLNEDAVREIRARRKRGQSIVAIARQLGFKESTVGAVARRQNWRHI